MWLLTFGLCAENAGNPETFYTTIRHEGIHVVQLCLNGLIQPNNNALFLSVAQDNGWDPLGYPEDQWDGEAEARVLANKWQAEWVAAAIREACNV